MLMLHLTSCRTTSEMVKISYPDFPNITQEERDMVTVENGLISIPVDYWIRLNKYISDCEKCFETFDKLQL